MEGKGEGIYLYRMHPATGALEFDGKTTGVVNPSYLAVDPTQRFLYAVNELKTYEDKPTGTVSAFAVDAKSGQLEFLNKRLTHGTDPCHVVVDGKSRYVFVANFMSGSVCVLPMRTTAASARPPTSFSISVRASTPSARKDPHAHSVTLDKANRFAFVPDLGLDKLMVYRFDRTRGMLEPHAVPWIKVKPGAGPRHVALHPAEGSRFSSTNWTPPSRPCPSTAGRASSRSCRSSRRFRRISAERARAPMSRLRVRARFLYGSNRGHDSLVIYRINRAHGTPRPTSATSRPRARRRATSGSIPRGRFLLVANQDTDTIVTFRIDPQTGTARPTGQVAQVPTPVCVKFLARRTDGLPPAPLPEDGSTPGARAERVGFRDPPDCATRRAAIIPRLRVGAHRVRWRSTP